MSSEHCSIQNFQRIFQVLYCIFILISKEEEFPKQWKTFTFIQNIHFNFIVDCNVIDAKLFFVAPYLMVPDTAKSCQGHTKSSPKFQLHILQNKWGLTLVPVPSVGWVIPVSQVFGYWTIQANWTQMHPNHVQGHT